MAEVFDDLQTYIEACKSIHTWRQIEGADWNCEIGAVTEAAADLIPEPPMLIFDRIKDYPPGYRVVTLLLGSYRRVALGLGLPTDRPELELLRLAARKVREAKPIPPREVADGLVMQNVQTEPAVDVLKFPAPLFHASDGGRYIGIGHTVIMRDRETGFVNAGTYRVQVHERNLLGLWMSPGQHGRQICQSYWDRGESCPVALTLGQDPITFLAAQAKIPWGQSELDYAGGLRGKPLEVIRGPHTGLPIPAHAEIALEGDIPPPQVMARAEGPFGEWTGYYSGGTQGTGTLQPVIQVKAVYHRDDPIIMVASQMWPGARVRALPIEAGILWEQLESFGIQDVTGVYKHSDYLWVVAIRQKFAGHAKQAAHAALSCGVSVRNGRYVVIVDEDIDPTDLKEVVWAMQTRVDPATDIEIVDGCWSTPLDPRMPPEKKISGDHTNSRAVFYAVRPFAWRDQFPKVDRIGKDLRQQMVEKYRSILPFP